MYIFNDGENEGTSFFYPLFTRERSSVKIMPLLRYVKFSGLSFFSSCVLLIIGICLVSKNGFDDTLFTIFASLIFLTSIPKFFLFKADKSVQLVKSSVRPAPLYVSLDFAFFFLSLACMEVIYGKNEPEMVGPLACAILIFLFLAAVPILNQIAVRTRKNAP
jgi:hypothetical protein